MASRKDIMLRSRGEISWPEANPCLRVVELVLRHTVG